MATSYLPHQGFVFMSMRGDGKQELWHTVTEERAALPPGPWVLQHEAAGNGFVGNLETQEVKWVREYLHLKEAGIKECNGLDRVFVQEGENTAWLDELQMAGAKQCTLQHTIVSNEKTKKLSLVCQVFKHHKEGAHVFLEVKGFQALLYRCILCLAKAMKTSLWLAHC